MGYCYLFGGPPNMDFEPAGSPKLNLYRSTSWLVAHQPLEVPKPILKTTIKNNLIFSLFL